MLSSLAALQQLPLVPLSAPQPQVGAVRAATLCVHGQSMGACCPPWPAPTSWQCRRGDYYAQLQAHQFKHGVEYVLDDTARQQVEQWTSPSFRFPEPKPGCRLLASWRLLCRRGKPSKPSKLPDHKLPYLTVKVHCQHYVRVTISTAQPDIVNFTSACPHTSHVPNTRDDVKGLRPLPELQALMLGLMHE